MTEAAWLTSADPTAMLEYLLLVRQASGRKVRLNACACCRLVWELLTDKRSRIAVKKLEEYADDLQNERLRRDAYNTANAAYSEMHATQSEVSYSAACAVVCAAESAIPFNIRGNLAKALLLSKHMDSQSVAQAEGELLRELFGNPFRPVTLDPRWRSETVVALADSIYAERAFDRMPILADALEEAGCDHSDILTHCRGDGPHVRGCWVVDLLLGKV